MNIDQLTEFLGWVSVINLVYLVLASLMLIFMRGTLLSIHSRLMKIDEDVLSAKYFDFLSHYKVVTLVFVLTPYLALKIMGH